MSTQANQRRSAPAPKPAPPPRHRPKAKGTALAVIPPPRPPAPRSLLQVIAQATTNKQVDVVKMRELLTMQREIERHQDEREFNAALVKACSKMPRIVRDRENEHTRSKYATLENVSTHIDDIVHRHGFALTFGTANSPLANHYRIVCDLSHRNGITRQYFVDLMADTTGPKGMANKTPVQAAGSTFSYAQRYLKIMMFNLTIVGADNDGRPSLIKITAEQHERLVELAGAAQCPEPKLVNYLNSQKPKAQPMKHLSDLPVARFDEACTAIKDFERTRKERERAAQASNQGGQAGNGNR